MAKTAQITLGETTFGASALDLGQYEDIIDDIADMSSPSAKERMRAAKAVVMSAWLRFDPSKTDADFRSICATPIQLIGAAMQILELSGLMKEPQPGEAAAGVAPAAL